MIRLFQLITPWTMPGLSRKVNILLRNCKTAQANVAFEAISSAPTRFNIHDVVVTAAQVGSALSVLVRVCCQPIIPKWADRLFPEFLTGWRSLPIWRVLMSPYWRTTACRSRSGLTILSGAVLPGFLPEIRPATLGSAELCRFRREIAGKEPVG